MGCVNAKKMDIKWLPQCNTIWGVCHCSTNNFWGMRSQSIYCGKVQCMRLFVCHGWVEHGFIRFRADYDHWWIVSGCTDVDETHGFELWIPKFGSIVGYFEWSDITGWWLDNDSLGWRDWCRCRCHDGWDIGWWLYCSSGYRCLHWCGVWISNLCSRCWRNGWDEFWWIRWHNFLFVMCYIGWWMGCGCWSLMGWFRRRWYW